MEAGGELDALVAERVFDWVWMSRADDSPNSNPYKSAWLFPPDSRDVDTGERDWFDRPIIKRTTKDGRWLGIVGPFRPYDGGMKEGACFTLPNYSTDIAAAWEVVEKIKVLPERGMRKFGGRNTPEFVLVWDVDHWYVDFDGQGTVPPIHAEGETAPLAICLAALKAVEAKPK